MGFGRLMSFVQLRWLCWLLHNCRAGRVCLALLFDGCLVSFTMGVGMGGGFGICCCGSGDGVVGFDLVVACGLFVIGGALLVVVDYLFVLFSWISGVPFSCGFRCFHRSWVFC